MARQKQNRKTTEKTETVTESPRVHGNFENPLPHGRGSVGTDCAGHTGGGSTTGQQPANFGEVVRAFLKEAAPIPDGDGDADAGGGGRDRLRALIERLYEDDPKFLLQFLTGYAYGKPADRTESSITVSGVPEKFVELFRGYAKEL